MDATTLTALSALIATLFSGIGGGFAWYKFKRTAKRDASTDLVDMALRLSAQHETEMARKNEEIALLQRQLETARERIALLEQRQSSLLNPWQRQQRPPR